MSFAALAGRDVGHLADPARTTAIHARHVAAGAVFEDVGQWKRPRYYPRAGEDLAAAVHRECTAARTGVAMMDVGTLGRIEVVGGDAAEFLNRMYTNAFAKLRGRRRAVRGDVHARTAWCSTTASSSASRTTGST